MDGVESEAMPNEAAETNGDSYVPALVALCAWVIVTVLLFLPIILGMWMALDIGDDGPVLSTWLVPAGILVLVPAAVGTWRAKVARGSGAKRTATVMVTAAITSAACGVGSLVVLALIEAVRY